MSSPSRFFWGYSLAFSETGSLFIGNLRHFGLMNVDLAPSQGSTKIPALLFCIYQMMFATITPVLVGRWICARDSKEAHYDVQQVIGGCAERARLLPIRESPFSALGDRLGASN